MKNKLRNALKERITGETTKEVDKQKSLMLLLIWLVFIIIIFFVVRNGNSVSNNQNNSNSNNNSNSQSENGVDTKKQYQFLSLEEVFKKYEKEYNYNITVLNQENSSYIYFIGSIDSDTNLGKKMIDTKTINYKIDKSGAVDLDTNEEITDLYNGLLYYFFDLDNMYNYIIYLKAKETVSEDIKTYEYNSIYNDMDINIKIETFEDSIKEIVYKYNNKTYNIKLS